MGAAPSTAAIKRVGCVLIRFGFAFALAAVTAVIAAAPASADATLDKINRTGTITIGTFAAYAPFDFMADGKITGFDVDLGSEIARRMGVKAQWQDIDFKGVIAALKAQRVDILITAMTRTNEREAQIAFSAPYYDAGIGAAFPLKHPIAKPADLVGKVVGVQLGTSGEAYTRNISGISEIKTYDSILLALKDLENGRLQAVVNPLPAVKYNLRGLSGIGTTAVWKSSDVGINTRKEDTDLLAKINSLLAEFKKDGFLDSLDRKWF
jgi:ABC-type amino acid transport substrate-binding protein